MSAEKPKFQGIIDSAMNKAQLSKATYADLVTAGMQIAFVGCYDPTDKDSTMDVKAARAAEKLLESAIEYSKYATKQGELVAEKEAKVVEAN